jgi:outer membrane protein OmpA-like peptidoglycan-associated protein
MGHIIRSSTGALVAGMIAAGCASNPPASDVAAANTAISNAGQAIEHASADPHVAQYAPGELERASESLRKAKTAWNDKHDLKTTTHLAYLAQQRASTAQELANGRAAEQAVTVAAAQRDQAVSTVVAQRQAAPAPTATGEQQGLAGFAFGRARLPADAKPTIDELATTLKNNPDQMVVIEGHTDNVGPPEYNRMLAMQRAKAVRAALVREGVESGRITLQALGEQNPVASNDSPEGRKENRRAQVIIGGGGGGETHMVGSSQGASATASGEGEQSGQSEQNAQGEQNTQGEQKVQNGQDAESGQNGQDDRREPREQ